MSKAYYTTGIWEHFTVQDGLPDMKIECLFEDHRGRLWIGTHDQGVVCYEGGEFRTYSCREGLSGEGVFSVVEDGQGNLWLGTNRGLTVFDGREFINPGLDQPGSFLWGSCRDHRGRLWFGMERQPGRPPMVVRWDGKRLECLEVDRTATEQGQSIHQITCDGRGIVWLGGERLHRYVEGEGFSVVTVPFTGEFVEGLSTFPSGEGVWISTETRLWAHDISGFRATFTAARTQGPISLIPTSSEGAWLATYDGRLFFFDGDAFHLIRDLSTIIRSNMCLDERGRLWVGTYGMGLYTYEIERIRVIQEANGLPGSAVLCLAEDKTQGSIWVGTRKGMVHWSHEHHGSQITNSTNGIEITALVAGNDEKLWIGTRFGRLLSYDKVGAAVKTFSISPLMDNYRIGSIAEDMAGRIWFGFPNGKGFGYCHEGKTVGFLPQLNADYPVWIGAIVVDSRGRVWLGSASPAQWEGLCCYDGVSFTQVKGVGQHAVLSLCEDREGRLWIGTSAGVKCYDGREFKVLTREDGLPCEIVTAIHQDLDGTFWFGTEGGGVCRYDGQVCQGIQVPGDQRCNVIHAILQDSGGHIWLATEGGLVEYTRTRIKPEVFIEEVTADKRYACPRELQIPSTITDIRIRLRAQSQAYPRSALVYRYRLEGFDSGWRQTRDPWIEYSQLKAGSYTFTVEVVDPDLNYSPARHLRIEFTADPRIGAINEAVWSSVGRGEFVGASSALQKVLSQIQVVAPSSLSVLILGETGTGKGLVARAVHVMSGRRDGPFVFVNCGTLQGSLVDSELFGHERGAFTGATNRRIGKFELAEGGSIFLDEIGDLPVETQVCLLHVIQDRFIERVGGTRSIPIDVRIIAATNRDLRKAVDKGQFRADLFFRLNDFPLVVPPLRERMEDVPLLAVYFVRQIAGHLDRPVPRLSQEAMELLVSYDWPGNIRELEHVLRRAVIQVVAGEITPGDLALDAPVQGEVTSTGQAILPIEEYERRYLCRVLEHTGGVISGSQGAAVLLGLHPNTLRSRMKKLGIKKPKKE